MTNFIFDIETVALPTDQLQAIMPIFNAEEIKTGHLVDPEKIAAKIEKARIEQFSRFMKRAALSALTGQIAMLGIKDEYEVKIIQGEEIAIVNYFLSTFEKMIEGGGHWIGFNISSFDIPFLVRRAWFHRIPIPYGIVRGRYLTSFFTDLLQLWNGSEYGNQFDVSLDDLARFFNVGLKSGDGADFGELLRYDPKKAEKYLTNDLEITWKVAEAMGAFKRPLPDQSVGLNGPPDPGPATQQPDLQEIRPGLEFY